MRNTALRYLRYLMVAIVLTATGLASTTTWADYKTEYKYDELGRVKTVIYKNDTTVVYTIEYEYDAAGNRTVVTATKS